MLDADAAKQVIRRAAAHAAALPPQGGRGQPPAGRLDRLRPRRPVPRPLRHRPRADPGRRRGPEPGHRPLRGDRGPGLRRLPPGRPAGERGRRVLPAGCPPPRLRPPDAPLDAVLRPREGRRRGVPDDLRRRVPPGTGPVRAAHVRDQHPAAGLLVRGPRGRLVAAAPGLLVGPAPRDPGQHPLPAAVQPGLPGRPGPDRLDAVGPPAGDHRRAGHPGLRAGGRRGRALPLGEPGPLRRPHGVGEDPGLVPADHRVRGPRDHGGGGRHRRLAGLRGRGDRGHRHVLRAHPLEPVRAGPAAQPAVQRPAVGRRRAEQALRAARHPGRRGRAARGRRPARPG